MAFVPFFVLLLLAIAASCQDTTPSGPTQPKTVSNCNKWYTVKSGDSCFSVETDFKISHADFLKWNPDVSDDCITNFWVKYSYCIGIDSTLTSKPTSTTSKSSSSASEVTSITSKGGSTSDTSTSANSTYSIRNPVTTFNVSSTSVDTSWPPKKTQSGQPDYCNKWYLVEAGDTCDTVYSRFGTSMTMKQLDPTAAYQGNRHEWNPAIDEDCSGLYFGWWICVGAQPRSSLTLVWTDSPGNVTIPTYDPFTPPTFATINSSFSATPTQSGLASDCNAFYSAAPDDTCTKVLEQFNYISREEFFKWNPALKGNCDGLFAHYWYCVADYGTNDVPMPPTVTKAPSDLPNGIAGNCVAWYQMTGSDTCDSIAAMFGTFSKTDFIKWNPDVWSNCSHIKEENWYCVAVPETPKTRTSLATRPLPVSATPTSTIAAVGARAVAAVALPTKI